MTSTLWGALWASAAAVTLLMTFLWAIQLKSKNAGIVDLGWVLCILLMAVFSCFFSPGDSTRRMAVFLMVFIWGARLLFHLGPRFFRHPQEDARYHQMRLEKKEKAAAYFLFIFLFQAATAFFLSAAFWIASADTRPGLGPFEIAALLLWGIALLGESLADFQLARFKKNPSNRGKVCETGLWNYSRHPNYFFECLLWVSFFLMAAGSPYGLWAAVSPALMIFFIMKVSGLPPAEEQSLRSKGDLYRIYQRTTSPLIPWFKKKIS